MESDQIQACHWLRNKKRIICKFVNRKFAEKILRKKSDLRHLNKPSVGLKKDDFVYINESLCPAYKNIWLSVGS